MAGLDEGVILHNPPYLESSTITVEQKYLTKTPQEHILLRPDSYIGAVEPITQMMWVFDEGVGMCHRETTYVPGLLKLFDEIISNAVDSKFSISENRLDCIKIEISPKNNYIQIWNNGVGIPIVKHKDNDVMVPTLLFGHLRSSSNFCDDISKLTSGRNGYGAKLCNIFSTQFTVQTASMEFNKMFQQTWKNNMNYVQEPKITPMEGKNDFTCVTFYPDLSKFKMIELDKDIIALMNRRVYDIAGCTTGVKIFLNGEELPVKNFKEYIELYLREKKEILDDPVKLVHEIINERWEIAVVLSDSGFNHISFVNCVSTTNGGKHVDYITDQLTAKIGEAVKRQIKGENLPNVQEIKAHLWVFINCLIENPTFTSQTKEFLSTPVKRFGSSCILPTQFVNKILSIGIVEAITSWVEFKAQRQLTKLWHGRKINCIRGIPKLHDAIHAGTKNSVDCTLILTEGDSAKALVVSAINVLGRDKYGVYPLKGKILNVREATKKQLLENKEILNIIKIVGLKYKTEYKNIEDLKQLRYGKIMIMADQDIDGSHIKGLLINFLHFYWPSLLHLPFLDQFITPLVRASKGKLEQTFYSLEDFNNWKKETPSWGSFSTKYYKGLGTSTAAEAKEYFINMDKQRIEFVHAGSVDDAAFQIVFTTNTEVRKKWLQDPQMPIYKKNSNNNKISYSEFFHTELKNFCLMDNRRSLPSVIDGLKPSQRKILHTCFLKNYKSDIKVSDLAGSVSQCTAYHHGEVSLTSAIVNLAQNFVGSNNVNLLQPIGQFGTRLQGGRDSASPRYIFTKLNKISNYLFPNLDIPLLNEQWDNNNKIEPEYFVPVIPMVLVNGATGIGSGWSTKIPNYNPRDLVANIYRMLDGKEPFQMKPWYKNFQGTIECLDSKHYLIKGTIAFVENQFIITELPIGSWTENYKIKVLEKLLRKKAKISDEVYISDYKEYHTDTMVKFIISVSQNQCAKIQGQDLHDIFKLKSTLSLTTMVCYNHLGNLTVYDTPEQILEEFYDVRFQLYKRRKMYMVGILQDEVTKLENEINFVSSSINGSLQIQGKNKTEAIKVLTDNNLKKIPTKKYYPNIDDTEETTDTGYDYLLGMPIWNLTSEKMDELEKRKKVKTQKLLHFQNLTPVELWKCDLETFVSELDCMEEQEGKFENKTQVPSEPKKRARKKSTSSEDDVQKFKKLN